MTDYTASPITLSGESTLQADYPSTVGPLSGSSSIVISGLLVVSSPTRGVRYVSKYVGEPNTPHDIHRLRRSIYELMRRMGTPLIIKPMYTARDVDLGSAEPSPDFSSIYEQTRNRDPLSHGVGFVSKEKSTNEWYDSNGVIVVSDTSPGSDYTQAPKYRGYGPGVLTWVIEPDATEDFFKHTPEGVLIKVQTATAQTAWWPDINDNDLLIHVEVDDEGNILGSQDRYQAKMTNPVSLRGRDKRGRREYSADLGNRYIVNQTFQMALLPRQHELYNIDIDR